MCSMNLRICLHYSVPAYNCKYLLKFIYLRAEKVGVSLYTVTCSEFLRYRFFEVVSYEVLTKLNYERVAL